MSTGKHISAHSAYRKGLWNVRVWPILINILIASTLVYAIVAGVFPIEIALIVQAAVLLLSFIVALRQRNKWRMWMVNHSENPKTSLELARASFLRNEGLDRIAFWGKNKRLEFQETFDARMQELRAEHLEAAASKYEKFPTINVYHKFSGLVWMFLFELLVVGGVVYLFLHQEDNTIKIILSVLMALSLGGIWYTLKTIWKRNTTVLEISKHGIRIQHTYYGWLELEHIDVVRGDTLEFQKNGGRLQTLTFKNLSLSADYLDELILFYRSKSSETV